MIFRYFFSFYEGLKNKGTSYSCRLLVFTAVPWITSVGNSRIIFVSLDSAKKNIENKINDFVFDINRF